MPPEVNIMNYKIITDSSSDVYSISDVPFCTVPLTIRTAEKEFTDSDDLCVHDMLDYLATYKGKSSTACPSVGQWTQAFGDAENIFCVTITSNLSGSYNSARNAADEYMKNHPERKVFVVDTLSTGPESALVIDKLRKLITEKVDFDAIVEKIKDYMKKTHLIFALESMHNLANNGRVSPLVAKFAGALGIRVIGKASDVGTLEITDKVRGAVKTTLQIVENMKKTGFDGLKARIHHCENLPAAEKLKEAIISAFPKAIVEIFPTRGLCSFYAERGGLLIGYEGAKR